MSTLTRVVIDRRATAYRALVELHEEACADYWIAFGKWTSGIESPEHSTITLDALLDAVDASREQLIAALIGPEVITR